jgi:hypothetical protein
MREPTLSQGARWTASRVLAARRIACAGAVAAAFAPACADAQRAPAPRESGGRGTIVYEEAGRSRIVYFEQAKAGTTTPTREEASTKATRAGISTTAVADAPARRAEPRRVVAPGDTRADR